VDVSDFVYSAPRTALDARRFWRRSRAACPSHLGDTGFCKPIVEPSDEPTALPEVTQADIDRVKAEYEAKQVAKKAKDKDKDKEEAKKADDKSSKPTTPTPPAVVTPKPPPRKFALQRDFFAMRIDAQRTKAAKAVRGLTLLFRS
jgi:hypothetical protein